ncbi:MAG: hypothetical protein EOL97_12825 [Spirochaetia bacterium]|nr:hypothetical protein [Spirochaetia bacterium]
MSSPNFRFRNTSFNIFLSALQKIFIDIFEILGIDPKKYAIFEMINEDYVPNSQINARTIENKTLSDIYNFSNRYDYDNTYIGQFNIPNDGLTAIPYPWGNYSANVDFLVLVYYDGKLLVPTIDYNLNTQNLVFTSTKTAHITIVRFHK